MAMLELINVNKYFGEGTARVHVLKDVNFAAEAGEMVVLLGPSGSGKSTFLTIAGGLLTPSSGTVIVDGEKVENLNKKQRNALRLNKIGFVLQAYNLVPFLTMKEQFELVDRVKKTGNISKPELDNLLKLLDIYDFKNKYPSQLSGGQVQRTAIARALYTDPKIILADEPTAALDTKRVEEVGKLLHRLAHEHNKAIVVVTHDLRLLEHADKVYDLRDGKIYLEGE